MGDYADHNGVGHNMTPAQVDRFVEQQKDRPPRPLGSKPYSGLVHRTDAYGQPCVYTPEEAARLDDVERQMDEAEWRSVGVRIEHDEEGPSVWVEHLCVARPDQRMDKAAGYDACVAEQERTARAIADAFAWYRREALEALVESLAPERDAAGGEGRAES